MNHIAQLAQSDRQLILDSLDNVFVELQPLVCLKSGQVRGFESLARLIVAQSPVGGLIGPDIFIPVFEAAGRMPQLTARVIEQSVKALSIMRQIDDGLIASINLSMQDLEDRSFLRIVEDELTRHQLPAECLQFELTETSRPQDLQACLETARLLKSSGYRLSIDDFGTGCASLKQLHEFPFDELKIDRSFIACVNDNDCGEALVDACIAMAKAFGLKIGAEGIESKRLHDIVRAKGCDIGQGYYYAKPLSVSGFERWICCHQPSSLAD